MWKGANVFSPTSFKYEVSKFARLFVGYKYNLFRFIFYSFFICYFMRIILEFNSRFIFIFSCYWRFIIQAHTHFSTNLLTHFSHPKPAHLNHHALTNPNPPTQSTGRAGVSDVLVTGPAWGIEPQSQQQEGKECWTTTTSPWWPHLEVWWWVGRWVNRERGWG